MDAPRSSFEFIASLYLPADAGKRGIVLHAASDWAFAPERFPADADIVAWGRPPARTGAPTLRAMRVAIDRERALRTRNVPPGYRRRTILRLPPPAYGLGGMRSAIRGLVLGGAVVSIERADGTPTVLDEVVEASGVSRAGRLRVGAGVTASLVGRRPDGGRVLLRLGPAETPDDPERIAQCLDMLAAAGMECAPRILSRGRVPAVSWTVESLLPGHRPRELSENLVASVTRCLARVPRHGAPPTAHRADLETIASTFPDRRHVLDAIGRRIDDAVRSLPGVLRHGDLWAGNLLVRRRTLCGIVDWDAWHASGAPAADLMHLIVTDISMRTRRPRGVIWAERPWRQPAFRAALRGLWPPGVAAPDDDALEAIALSGWAAQVAGNLVHAPELSTRRRWIAGNIDPVAANR